MLTSSGRTLSYFDFPDPEPDLAAFFAGQIFWV